MKIVVDARWDGEAATWVARARDEIGLVTEASRTEALERRIALVVPDLLLGDASGPFEIELIATRSWTITT